MVVTAFPLIVQKTFRIYVDLYPAVVIPMGKEPKTAILTSNHQETF